MDYAFYLAGQSPVFEEDDIDWAMGELLHMIWEAKKAGARPHDYNPLLFYRCMHVVNCQPLEVRQRCIQTIRDTQDRWYGGSTR